MVSNTLYTESQLNELRPLLNEATPIVNPVTGKYESSFVYNNPSGYQYLYLVWDLTNAYSVDLCYDATDRVAACELCGSVPHYAIELCYDSTDLALACDCNPPIISYPHDFSAIGESTSSAACYATLEQTFYTDNSALSPGDIVYVDSDLTSPFFGMNLWYASIGGKTYLIDNTGTITSDHIC